MTTGHARTEELSKGRAMGAVLYALPFLHFGVGRLVLDLAAAAVASGRRVHVVTAGSHGELSDDPAQLAEFAALGGTRHHADVFARDAEVMRRAAIDVGVVCRAHGVALAHAFTAPAAAACLTHVPVVASAVGWAANKADWQKQMDADILERCDAVTAVSSAVEAELRAAGVSRPDVRLITHGVSLEPCRSFAQANPNLPLTRIGIMAQLIARKGVDVLIEALAALPRGTWAELVVAGDGDAGAELRALASRLLPGRVTWLGRTNLDDFYSRVDVVVVPSRADALPLMLLQTMAYGLPVVASAVDGIPEAITDGVEGLLAAPGDVRSLASALSRTLDAPVDALRRAMAARRRIERDFSIDATMARYLACYDEVGPLSRVA